MTDERMRQLRALCEKATPKGDSETDPGNPVWGPRLRAFQDAMRPRVVAELLDEVERLRAAWLGSDVRDVRQRLEASEADCRMYRARLALVEPVVEAAKKWRAADALFEAGHGDRVKGGIAAVEQPLADAVDALLASQESR